MCVSGGKWTVVRRKSNCKNCEVAACLVRSKNRKEASVGDGSGENKRDKEVINTWRWRRMDFVGFWSYCKSLSFPLSDM